jgi:hypothetical protein
MLDDCITSVSRERRAARLALLLTPHIGATAAAFLAERITHALLTGGGDVVAVTQTMLPLPPAERRRAAVQVANVWHQLSLGY